MEVFKKYFSLTLSLRRICRPRWLLAKGQFINYVALKGGIGFRSVSHFVTGRGRSLVDAYIRMGKKYKHSFISLVLCLLGLVVWFCFFYR